MWRKGKYIVVIVFLLFLLYMLSYTTISEPIFSVKSGFYDSEFELQITTANPNLSIYYTVDGSIPNTESLYYTGPIRIYDYSINENNYSTRADIAFEEGHYGYVWTPKKKVRKAMLVKAVAYNQFGESSNVVSRTYFVGEGYGDLPVISISMDPEDLFGYNGIYVKGKTFDEWYKKIRINYMIQRGGIQAISN